MTLNATTTVINALARSYDPRYAETIHAHAEAGSPERLLELHLLDPILRSS